MNLCDVKLLTEAIAGREWIERNDGTAVILLKIKLDVVAVGVQTLVVAIDGVKIDGEVVVGEGSVVVGVEDPHVVPGLGSGEVFLRRKRDGEAEASKRSVGQVDGKAEVGAEGGDVKGGGQKGRWS